MIIGLIDVDSHNFPNYALMKISAYHKDKGDIVEWYSPFTLHYDIVYLAKIFTFSEDYGQVISNADKIIKGGTGYDISSKLPNEIDTYARLDYDIYPQYKYSVQFLSRGCIRHCPFCLVHDKEGNIKPAKPANLNKDGEWIEVLDNNFFANPEWRDAVRYLIDTKQPVNLHGVDIRIMDDEQSWWLGKMKFKRNIHIAWDLPQYNLEDNIKELLKHFSHNKVTCYVLVGFNSTIEQDLHRLEVLKKFKITPFVQPYRDFENRREPTSYEKDLARWANRMWLFKSTDFADYAPRKGFTCSEYLK
jgi:hypothetical protein